MSHRTRSTSATLRLALLVVALGYPAFSSASIISLDFVVEVTKRELHNGPGGQSGFNWVEDTSYGGEQFELSFQIDTGSVQSNASLAFVSAEAPVLGLPATPFDAEIDAALAGWNTFRGDPDLYTWQTSEFFPPYTLSGGVSLSAGNSEANTTDPWQSTSGMSRNISLTTATNFIFVTLDDLVNEHLITQSDFQQMLSELQSTGAPLFEFHQAGLQWQGTPYDYFSGIAHVEGVQYSGTARVKAADVPLPSTLWLLLVGVFGTCIRRVVSG